ncbi:hypothetical protein KI387_017404, partial [Taxus chinensis]
GDDCPFMEVDRAKAPKTIQERVNPMLQRTKHWCKKNGLTNLGVDFTTSPS